MVELLCYIGGGGETVVVAVGRRRWWRSGGGGGGGGEICICNRYPPLAPEFVDNKLIVVQPPVDLV
ncbi:hypothetical protein Hanom_Chr13g01203561 [Helianthus anomalus]